MEHQPSNDDQAPQHRTLQTILKGFLMGNADVVPGVSGGTVALLLGIYDHLIHSIGKFDSQFCSLLVKRNWRQAAAHVHLRFILSLLLGICIGILCMATLSHWLLEHQQSRQFTLAAFSGMVLASCFIIAKQIQIRNRRCSVQAMFLGLIGITITVLAGSAFQQDPSPLTDPTYFQLFCFAAIAICAMILPGISGAMILMILGVYEHLVALPEKLIKGDELGESAKQLIIFVCGATLGLIAFSRVLRHLLTQYRHGTLSLLIGIMLGSLNVLWPFQDINKQPLPIALDVHSALLIITIAFSTRLVLWLVKLSNSAPTQD
jgi:putative membrane protein